MSLEVLNTVNALGPPGWYLACFSNEVRPGKVIAADVLGERLAIARTESGRAVAYGRYCAHMGASLAGGAVVKEELRCPFHQWRYDASGRCVAIPGCEKIPSAARVKTYPVIEKLDGIWVFAGGDDVYYELPDETTLFGDSTRYFCASTDDLGEVKTSGQDILENAVDLSHADTLHFVHVDQYEVRRMEAAEITIDADITIMGRWQSHTVTSIFGPGLWVAWLSGGFYQLDTLWALMPTPIAPGVTRLRAVTYVEGNKHLPWIRLAGKLYTYATRSGAEQDMAIWNHKIVQPRPVLSAADAGPVMKFRKWFEQLGKPSSAPVAGAQAAAQPHGP